MRAYVVWEPVIATDLGPPSSRNLARIPDVRAAQFWDSRLRLSRTIVQAAMKDPSRFGWEGIDAGAIVWDVAAYFPPGARWEAEFPVPAYHGYPIVAVVDELRRALEP